MHALRSLLGKAQSENAAHREPTDEDDVAVAKQSIVRSLDAGIPFAPGRPAQLFGGAAVTGELAAVGGMAGTRQAVGNGAQLDGRPSQAVDEKHAEAPARHELAAVGDLGDKLVVPVSHRATHPIRRPPTLIEVALIAVGS